MMAEHAPAWTVPPVVTSIAPMSVRAALFDDRGPAAHVLLDGARLAPLRSWLEGPLATSARPLWASEAAAAVAPVPWLAPLEPDTPFSDWVLDDAWGRSAAVFLTSSAGIDVLARHLRALTRAYGPALEPVVFRFHDPRTLRLFLPICDPAQVAPFFGPVEAFIAEDEVGAGATLWRRAGHRIVSEPLGPDAPPSTWPRSSGAPHAPASVGCEWLR